VELTRQADYALRCVLETARHERISARELAERQHLSPSFVGKIVSALAHAGILETRRGAAGGVRLGRPPASISVLEVIEAAQGPLRVNRCVRTPPACSLVDRCPLAGVIRDAQDALVDALGVTFDELLARDEALRSSDAPPRTVVVERGPGVVASSVSGRSPVPGGAAGGGSEALLPAVRALRELACPDEEGEAADRGLVGLGR
jgi:Rrf2 family protein